MKSAVGNDVSDHIAAGLTLDQLMPWWPPPADQEPEPEDETNAAEPESDIRFIPGGTFILDTDPTPRVIWGEGDQVGWAEGESLIIAGAQGLGKTTIAQQLVLGWIGIEGFECLFGFPIKRGKRVLYLAMDRPREIARSFRRMVHPDLRAALDDRLLVWPGPPPGDLAKFPSLLLHLCDKAHADAVAVDSIKDAAVKLSDDEVGSGYNRARQYVCAAGIQMLELHHPRKYQNSAKKDDDLQLDDLYGSTWITGGSGSVILLTGKPGDPIVKMRHLKQPAAEIGPFQILHNDITGRSTIWHEVDLVVLTSTAGSISAVAAAEALYDVAKPTPAQKQKARRRLDQLVVSGHLWVFDQGDEKTKRPRLWAAR